MPIWISPLNPVEPTATISPKMETPLKVETGAGIPMQTRGTETLEREIDILRTGVEVRVLKL